MTIDTWSTVWAIVITLAVSTFALLAVVVAIGGFRDVQAMFRQLNQQHTDQQHDGDN